MGLLKGHVQLVQAGNRIVFLLGTAVMLCFYHRKATVYLLIFLVELFAFFFDILLTELYGFYPLKQCALYGFKAGNAAFCVREAVHGLYHALLLPLQHILFIGYALLQFLQLVFCLGKVCRAAVPLFNGFTAALVYLRKLSAQAFLPL